MLIKQKSPGLLDIYENENIWMFKYRKQQHKVDFSSFDIVVWNI